MKVEYTVLLRNEIGDEYKTNGSVNIVSEKGYFGDKDFNGKVAEAIYSKHPNCTILEFKPNDVTE